ncbi:MAG: MoaD/ThiS family protein [Alphaproteobacteria bacterium]|nr:MoaD/ThiS family protein [Alphaproteobacteria bacterium]
MALLIFTSHLKRHLNCDDQNIDGYSVKEILDNYFLFNQQARDYILDNQNQLRKHVNIFINNSHIKDRKNLTDPVNANDKIYIFQALSGG